MTVLRKVLILALVSLLVNPAVAQDRTIRFIDLMDPENDLLVQADLVAVLAQAAQKKEIRTLLFDEYGAEPVETELRSIAFGESFDDLPEWQSGEIYYMGDLITYKGVQYEAMADMDSDQVPGESEDWLAANGVMDNLFIINKIGIEFSGEAPEPGAISYLHFHYDEDGSGAWADGMNQYLFSFSGKEVFSYLHDEGLVVTRPGTNNNLLGGLFLESPTVELVHSVAAKTGSIESPTGMEYDYGIARNLLSPDDDVWFLYRPTWSAWKGTPTDIPGEGTGSIMQMATLLYDESLISFADMEPVSVAGSQGPGGGTSSKETGYSCRIVESLSPVARYAVRNAGDQEVHVYLDDVTQTDWEAFIGGVNGQIEAGRLTVYQDASLEKQLSNEEAIDRLKLYELEEFEVYDRWNQDANYFEGDVVEINEVNYRSRRDNNKGRIPNQYPEYWELHLDEVVFYETDEISLLFVASDLVFDTSGNVQSVTPRAVSLGVPGEYVPTGLTKILGWVPFQNLSGVPEGILGKVKRHEFRAEVFGYSSLRAQY